MTEVMTVLLYVLLGFLAFLALYSVACGIGRMKCADRAGVAYGWMAFLPVLRHWTAGKIAEKSVELRRPGKKPFKWGALNAALEVLSVLFAVGAVFSALAYSGMFISTQNRFLRNIFSFLFAQTKEEFMTGASRNMTATVLIVLTAVALLAFKDVISYVTLYKTYAVFTKKSGILFVLTYFLPILEPILLLVYGFGHKDLIVSESGAPLKSEKAEEKDKEEEKDEPYVLPFPGSYGTAENQ